MVNICINFSGSGNTTLLF